MYQSKRSVFLVAVALVAATPILGQPSLFRGPGTPENPGPNVVVRHGLEVAAEVLSNNPASLWIDLPDAPAILVEQSDFEQRRGNGLVWRGRVPYAGDSQVVLTRHKGLVAGTIQIDGDTYEIAPGPGRSQAIKKLDLASFPACDGGPIAPGSANDSGVAAGPSAPATAGAADPNAEMHLLAMYTPQARDAAGGVAGIEATIQAAVDNANTAFANSNMFGRYVLVHTALANYNDSGNLSNDLSWIRTDATTAGLRDQHGADMVSLIVNSGGCGIGYVQRNPGPGFAGSAFQVTVRSCAVGNLTFAHEHGHNLGFEHDPANSSAYPSAGSFDWSFGSAIGGNVARTVMAYPAACTSSCTRLMYHSNPDVFYGGFPTGNAADRDNARTGDTTAYIAHDFRPDATPATLVSISVAPSTANIITGATQQFTATGHYDDATTDDLTFDVAWSSANTAVATINGSGVATGQGDGAASITAALDGVTSNAATVNVTSPTLTSIVVTPASASVETTETQQFTATGHYDDSSSNDITSSVSWASSNAAAATINGSGEATGVAAGSSNITASLDGVTSTPATLTVTDPTLVSITVAPANVNLAPGGNQQLTATGAYSNGTNQDLTAAAAWSSSNAGAASVAAGLVTANAVGSANVTATADGVTSNAASVTVAEAFNLTGFSPTVIPFDAAMPITITGTGFVDGATLSFQNGSGKTPSVSSLLVKSSTTIEAMVSVSGKGKKGDRTWQLVVTNGSGGGPGVVPGTLLVTNNPPANNTPTVSISSPADGATFANGALISFAGSANDIEDGDLSAGLSWSSNLDGAIGSGASFSTAVLSEGVHVITAAATDSGGATGNTSVSITVGNPPPGVTVSGISPATVSRNTQPTLVVSGAGFEPGAVVSFENGSGPTPTVITYVTSSATSIEVQINVPKGGKGQRTWHVRVTNPGGATGVSPVPLTVN